MYCPKSRDYLRKGQNPFARIRQRRQSTKPVRYVTAEEFQRLLDAADSSWWRALLLVCYTTAARVGEALNLTWADLDFENNWIRIVGKEADGSVAEWEPKNHDGRLLPIPSEVMRLLAEIQAECAEGCPYVFVPNWRGTHLL